MSSVPPLIGDNDVGSQRIHDSEDELPISVSDLRQRVRQEIEENELEGMVIRNYPRLRPLLEDLTQPIVKEQVELAKRNTSGESCANEVHIRRLTLQFKNNLAPEILTGKEIKGKESESIEVALVDDLSGQIVESMPEAYAKGEIVVLKVNEDEGDIWTSEEFNNNIVRESNDKKAALLVGDRVFKLNKGVGVVPNVKFKHSSTHVKQKVLKLGARLLGSFAGTHVREAKTESFTVKDSRKEYYNKRTIPELSDSVWRLRNIARKKAIHKRLEEHQINSVEDFLVLLFKDPDRLKHITGLKPENWKVTVEHARKCKIDKRKSCYADPRKKMLVVFNLVDQVLGVVSGGHYIPIENLSENEKADARKLAVDSLGNWNDLVAFNDEDSVLHYFSSLYVSVDPASSRRLEDTQDEDINASQMSSVHSYSQLYASSQENLSSMDSALIVMDDALQMEDAISSQPFEYREDDELSFDDHALRLSDSSGVLPGEVEASSLCYNDFDMTGHPSPETMTWIRHANQLVTAANMVLDQPRPSLKWITLINILSLKRVVLRTNTLTYNKLLVHLVPDEFVVWKKRKIQ